MGLCATQHWTACLSSLDPMGELFAHLTLPVLISLGKAHKVPILALVTSLIKSVPAQPAAFSYSLSMGTCLQRFPPGT